MIKNGQNFLERKKKDRQRELYYLVMLRNYNKDTGKAKKNFKANQNFVIDLDISEWRVSTTQSSWLWQSLGQKEFSHLQPNDLLLHATEPKSSAWKWKHTYCHGLLWKTYTKSNKWIHAQSLSISRVQEWHFYYVIKRLCPNEGRK